MGDPLGAAGSIIGIAAFGLKFATTLQTYIEAVSDARDSLRDIAFDISATASALDQLHHFIKADENGKAIANDSGIQEVARLAFKCKQVYTAVIDLIAKAVGAPRDENGEILIDALDAIDLNESNVKRLVQKLRWPFQEPRIKKHQEELRWLKISLLFHLRLMEFAKTKITAPTRSFSAREKEIALQANLEKLLFSKQAYARKIASERRRNKRKVRGKRVLARTRSSSPISVVIIESRSTSPGGKVATSESPRTSGSRELSPSSSKSDTYFGVQNTFSSKEPIDDVLEYLPPQNIPKPPKSKSKRGTNILPGPIMFNQLPIEARPYISSEIENDKRPQYNIDPSNPPRPVPDTRYFVGGIPQPSPARNDTHPPTVQLSSNQAGAPDSSHDVNNEDKEGETSQIQAMQHLNNQHKSRLSRISLNFLPWPPRIFRGRSRNKSMYDHASQDLEAYLIEGDNPDSKSNPIRKLPFAHRQLSSMMKRIARSQGGDVWTQYTSLTSMQRECVDRALLEAHQTSSHVRTCVAISSGKPESPYVVVFFSLGMPAEPVHFNYNSRHFQFAFELCRTWEGMAALITSTLIDIPDPDLFLQSGQYDLKDADDRFITPSTWSSSVRPGVTVFLIPKGSWGRQGSYGRRGAAVSEPPFPVEPQARIAGLVRRGSGIVEEISTQVPSRLTADLSTNIRRVPIAAAATAAAVAVPYTESARDERLERTVTAETRSRRRYRSPSGVMSRRGYDDTSEEEVEGDEDEDEDGDGDEESDIIDFEEEDEMTRLGLDGLLGKWTNAFSAPPDGEQPQQREG
ncbi:hypothetical protein F4805DRAFT_446382 [Annulohypoxylon moriforme]|nr:hypothetical protein F4805DRAFT_446382 [Annulohypoxylon moriforme]